MQGWIKLHRKLLKSAMYKSLNSKQRDVMIQCLLLANHDENAWEWGTKMFTCKRGQFITSLESLKDLCAKDVKIQSVRTALLKLEKWSFLTNKSTKTGRLITILNWHIYQDILNEYNKDDNKELTNVQQTGNKELTTNKNVKNDNNEKESLINGDENLINDLCKYFGISEMKQPRSYMELYKFIKTLHHRGRLDYFKQQFKFYKLLKDDSFQRKHSWQNYIGTIENNEFYENGGWNMHDWEQKYKEHLREKNNEKENQHGSKTVTSKLTTYTG